MSKIGERRLRMRALRARRSWHTISIAPEGARTRAASLHKASGSRTCSIVCRQLTSVNASSGSTPATKGSGRISGLTSVPRQRRGACDGSNPTVRSNPAASRHWRNAPSPAPMSTAPRKSGSSVSIFSTRVAYVAAAYRASSLLLYPASRYASMIDSRVGTGLAYRRSQLRAFE